MGLKSIGLFGHLAHQWDLLAPKSQWDKDAGVVFPSFSEMLWFKFSLIWFYSFGKTPFSSTFGFAWSFSDILPLLFSDILPLLNYFILFLCAIPTESKWKLIWFSEQSLIIWFNRRMTKFFSSFYFFINFLVFGFMKNMTKLSYSFRNMSKVSS